MRVVSEQSSESIQRHRAEREVAGAIRELAANLLRVIRGAGKPHEIEMQVQAALEAFIHYRDLVGTPAPPDIVCRGIDGWTDTATDAPLAEEALHEQELLNSILQGALQVVASRLLGQLTHETRGRRQMHSAIHELSDLHAHRREQRLAEINSSKGRRKP